MQAKLTLRLDDRLIRRAKRLAKDRNKSVSEMVASFFEALEDREPPTEVSLPPLTAKLLGSLRTGDSDLDVDDYRRHLDEKHR